MKKYYCEVCDWVYDPELGDPDGGIAPGTPWSEVPKELECPLCSVIGYVLFAVWERTSLPK